MNITTPKLLEYAAKAVMIASSHAIEPWEEEHCSFVLSGTGRLTVTMPTGDYCKTCSRSVQIGQFEKYQGFIERMLNLLNNYTGRTYTVDDLNIY